MLRASRPWVHLVAALALAATALVVAISVAPTVHRPGELYRDPLGRFALRLPAGWAYDAFFRYSDTQNSLSWSPDGPEASFVDSTRAPLTGEAPEPGTGRPSPTLTVTISRWTHDLADAVYRFEQSYSDVGSPDVDGPMVLADGTPAHLISHQDKVGLVAVKGGWRYEFEVFPASDVALDAYRPGYFESTLHTVTLGAESAIGDDPLLLRQYDDPAGRFGLLLPPGFVLDTEHAVEPPVFVDPSADRSEGDPYGMSIRVAFFAGGPAEVQGHLRYLRRQEFVEARMYADEPLLLADGTPAHLIGGRVPNGGDLDAGVDEYVLVTSRDGRMMTVRIGGVLDESGSELADLVDITVRSVTLGSGG